jgi:hypothetical protein
MSPKDAVTVVRNIREKSVSLKGDIICLRYPTSTGLILKQYHPEFNQILHSRIKNTMVFLTEGLSSFL